MCADRAARIRELTDCQQIAQQLLGPGRRTGRAVQYRTPWRDDRNPSLTIWPNGWKDWATGEHGSVIDLVMRVQGCGFAEALDYLDGGKLGPAAARPVLNTPAADRAQPPGWAAAAAAALQTAQAHLWGPQGAKVRAYLQDVRGLSEAAIRAAGLGYAPSWVQTTYTPAGARRPASLPPGVVLPRYTPAGQLIALRVRTRTGALAQALDIADDRRRNGDLLDKYLSMAGSAPAAAWFGPADIAGRAVLICEGEFDQIRLQIALGAEAAVITLGSAAARLPVQLLDRLGAASRVIVCYDSDEAGRAGAAAIVQACLQAGIRAGVIAYPAGHKDACEAGAAGVDLLAWYRAAVLALDTPVRVHTMGALPDSWRAALAAVGAHDVRWVYELAVQAAHDRAIDPAAYTAAQLLAWCAGKGWDVRRQRLHEALQALEDFVRFACTVVIPTKSETGPGAGQPLQGSTDICTQTGQSTGGRPGKVYALPDLQVMRDAILARLAHDLRMAAAAGVIVQLPADALAGFATLTPQQLARLQADRAELIDSEASAAALQRAQAAYDRAYPGWAAALDNHTCTPLQLPLRNPRAYTAALLAAQLAALPAGAAVSAHKLAEAAGCGRNHVRTLARRAGYDSVRTPALTLQAAGGNLAPVYAAAKAAGARIVCVQAEGEARQVYSPAAAAALDPARTYTFTLHRPNTYTPAAAGPVQTHRPARAARPAPPRADDGPRTITAAQIEQRNSAGYSYGFVVEQLALQLQAEGWIRQGEGLQAVLIDPLGGLAVRAYDLSAVLQIVLPDDGPPQFRDVLQESGGRLRTA